MRTDPVRVGQKLGGHTLTQAETHLINKLVRQYAPLIVVVGETRKGKSMFGLELARRLHEDYNVLHGNLDIKNNLHYDPYDFIDQLDGLFDHFLETGQKKKQAIIMDEGGINLNSKSWYSAFNRAVDGAIQTQAVLNNCYIVILPKFKNLDKSLREHVNMVFSMRKRGKAKAIKYKLVPEADSGEKVIKPVYLRPVRLPMPPDKYVEAYQEKEHSFKHNLLKGYKSEIKKEKGEEAGEDLAMDW